MPKAPVDEYDFASRRENKVGFTGEIRTVKSVAVPHPMDQLSNNELRFRILRTNRAHIFRTLFFANMVHEWTVSATEAATII
jgi:hypothetical protein